MIEKFLTRFVNDDTKMVLAAMEKVGADLDASERLLRRSETMYDNARAIAPRIDLVVLTRAMSRIRETRNRARLRADTQDLAGKILMGEKFEEKELGYLYTGGAIGAGYMAQQQNLSGLMNGANSMGQLLAGYHGAQGQLAAQQDQRARYITPGGVRS